MTGTVAVTVDNRGRGWKGIRLPEGDSGGRRRHKTEPILSPIREFFMDFNGTNFAPHQPGRAASDGPGAGLIWRRGVAL